MSLILLRNEAGTFSRPQKAQWAANTELQNASLEGKYGFKALLKNSGITPDEAYREMEDKTKIATDPTGEFATWNLVNGASRSVGLGKLSYVYRQASEQTGGTVSMSGQTGVITDAVEYKNAGTVIPIIDHGTKREFREYLTFGADGFDTMVDDNRESGKVLMRTANAYLWDGDASIKSPDGNVWTGIRNDASLVQETTSLDMANASTTGKQIVDEIARLRDILEITNNCVDEKELGISREMFSYWERTPYNQNDAGYGTVLQAVQALTGISRIYRDPQLSGGKQLFMGFVDIDGFHAVTGQAMSNYMVQRNMHNDPFTMVKWMAQGYIAKADFNGKKTAMYVKSA